MRLETALLVVDMGGGMSVDCDSTVVRASDFNTRITKLGIR